MSGVLLNKKYNRADFASFLSGRFLPDDFEPSKTNIAIDKGSCTIKDAVKLGVCPSLDLGVYEFRHGSSHDPRVTLSRESFNILRNDIESHALAVFFNEDTTQWRFSLITSDYTMGKKKGQVKREFSNPRRFSYLLGENCKLHTPESMLINKGVVKTADDLIARFAIEVVTKEFYKELFKWYDDWAVALVKFPSGRGKAASLPKEPDIEKNRQHLIRLITRLIFVWFLKQKDGLVPEWIFDKDEISKVLNNFDANNEKQGNYYNGIIQNLFFATLNKPIHERLFANHEEAERNKDYMIKTAFRDFNEKSLFSIDYDPRKKPGKFVDLFNSIPFLNGGLFECLDNSDTGEYIDGFSREEKRVAFVPNCLFWGNGEREGLLTILKRYNFTIEENTPQDIDIALDPELLGKVFENLLGTYNKETQETARKESGSFYTPREIVDYMVDASLKEYLKGKLNSKSDNIDERLNKLFCYHEAKHDFDEEITVLMDAINNCKILDPACGSGAFPMGILNRLAFIMQKLDPRNEIWRKIQIKDATIKSEKAYGMEDADKRNKRLNEIQNAFDMSTGEYSNYVRKLFLIENCIYGVDIQPIAIQISKLRFFISLVVDQKTGGTSANNYNVLPLPNLETKFVVANTLIGAKRQDNSAFGDPEIEAKQRELLNVRHSHFSAREAKEKSRLRKADRILSKELFELLRIDGFYNLFDASQLANWNPYDQTKPSEAFDSYWMFGIKEGFDVVIGNPPYLDSEHMVASNAETREIYTSMYDSTSGNWDLFVPFVEKGIQLLGKNGLFTYIIPNKLISQNYAKKIREMILELSLCEIRDYSRQNVFPIADVYPIVFLLKNLKSNKDSITYLTSMDSITRIGRKNCIEKQLFCKYPWDFFFFDFEKTTVLIKIASNKLTLGSFVNFYSPCTVNEAYQIKSKLKDSKNLKGKKLINSGIIDRYVSLWGQKKIRYIKEQYQYPKISVADLTNINERRLRQSDAPKIIIANMTNEIEAVIDINGDYLAGKSTVIALGQNNHLKIMLALLNSRLISKWYKSANHSTKMAGEALSITSDRLECIPCPDLSSSPLQSIKIQLEILVDEIISCKETNPEIDTIKFEQEIDNLIYELYGLTEEEIKVIESAETI